MSVLRLILAGLLSLSAVGLVRGEETPPITPEEREHWAFQPIKHPPVPAVSDAASVNNPIDAFLLAKLEAKGLTFSPVAEKRVLLRRLCFDLTGQPPTREELENFQSDDSPLAWERQVEEYLASPAYGETWGRHWLDLVRFAETAGFNADPARPLAYKYRDYVIRAFNENKPYDRFVQEQLAGDELFPESEAARIATGYVLMWPDESNASDVLLARQSALNDLTGNVGAVYLGLTLGCAQCHDHKFDPLRQRDFYQIQSFFAGIVPRESAPVGTREQLQDYYTQREQWKAETAAVREELNELEATAKAKAGEDKRLKFPAVVLEAVDTAAEDRTAFQWQLVFWSERQIDLKEEQILKQLTPEQQARRTELRAKYEELKKQQPTPPGQVSGMVVTELPSGPPVMHRLAGGSYDKPLEEIRPQFISVLEPETATPPEIAPPRMDTSGRRSVLANWLTTLENPLTARVIVNRVWQIHMGDGLVENANDFGTQTRTPLHGELLDWLATEFVNSGWDLKALHRWVLTSRAYRQSTLLTEDHPGLKADPSNRLCWHFPRRRLNAEQLRDAMLSISGSLTSEMYGPGVRPDLPPKFSSREAWTVSKDPADKTRRSVYIYAKRNLPYPMMQAFDFPDMHESCARRSETIVAPQSLMLLNSDLIIHYAHVFTRLLEEQTNTPEEFVQQAFLRVLNRPVQPHEQSAALRFIAQQAEIIAENPQLKETAVEKARKDFCHALLNANEFMYLD